MDVMMRRRELMGMQGKLKTVSGPIVTVNDALARNAKSLVVNFAPVQAAGTPSPDNVLPISGWTGVTGYRSGKNLLDSNATEYYNYTIGPSGQETTGGTDDRICTGYMPCRGGAVLTAHGEVKWYNDNLAFSFVGIAYYTKEKVFISRTFANYVDYITGTTPANTAYIRFFMQYNNHSNPPPAIFETLKIQLEFGSSPTPYTPYTGTTYPVDWTDTAGTVYGGYVDLVSGVLVRTWADIILDGSESWVVQAETDRYYPKYLKYLPGFPTTIALLPNVGMTSYIPNITQQSDSEKNGILCARFGWGDASLYILNATKYLDGVTDVSTFKTYLSNHPLHVVYKLSTPITYQLTPQTIAMLRGVNNVWSNANGNTELTYYAQ